jgi:hypothetical protein
MPDLMTGRVTETGSHRMPWQGLGDHGFGYMDSFADTGGTLVPRCSRMAGGTGAFGDPRWETIAGSGDEFLLFAKAVSGVLMTTLGGIVERDFDVPYDWDVVTITPLRMPLRRPDVTPTVVAAPQVALEDVLNTLRAQAGLPVGDLATMLGVSRRQFYNWVSRENEPDTEQELRVRRTAALIEPLHERLGEARTVRAALLTTTPHGSAFDALAASDLSAAEAAIAAVLSSEQRPHHVTAPSQRQLPYDQEQVLEELAHLRDIPLRGDG